MKTGREGIFAGSVMHRRLRPHTHHFKYSVFSMFVDIDKLKAHGQRLRLFSHNRFNLFSLHDRDFGDGGDLNDHLDAIAADTVGPGVAKRFLMLCYPRVLGYAFNPLTVYYGLDAQDRTALVIYEVSNTFGERHTYATAEGIDPDGTLRHSCTKVFHVSPFNRLAGRYAFRTKLPDETAAVGIRLDDEDGPLMAAHFAGTFEPLTDSTLLKRFAITAFLTQKVWLGIRWEALRLWLKRLPVVRKPTPPSSAVSVYRANKKDLDIAA